MTRRRPAWPNGIWLALAMMLAAGAAQAHEVRPAYLEIDQTGPRAYRVIWKQPTLGDVAIHLTPHLSNGWLEAPPTDQYAAAGFLIRTWQVAAPAASPLEGRTVAIEGLDQTLTDVLVRVRLSDGRAEDRLLHPEAPAFRIALGGAGDGGGPRSAEQYLGLGMRHILTGPDHLLFVLGLLLLVRDRWMLVKTISAFTVAHSLTLTAATLGLVAVSTPLLNALIALSILFLAAEVVRAGRGETSLAIRRPWIVAFVFGLLHGLGFASGLKALGLDRSSLAWALLLFNVGVEIGQLAFVAVVLALRRSFRLMEIGWSRPLAMAPAWTIGVLGAAWSIRYGVALFGAAP